MRTTVNLDEDVLEAAKSLAHIKDVSLGEALSELARRGMEVEPELRKDPETGLMVMHIPGGGKITSAEVYKLQEEEGLEDAVKWMRKR